MTSSLKMLGSATRIAKILQWVFRVCLLNQSMDTIMTNFVALENRNVNLAALHYRLHNKPVYNPFALPPNHRPPEDWPLFSELPTKDQLQKVGIQTIYVDTSPWTTLSKGQINSHTYEIAQRFGPPTDIGCAHVWFLDNTLLKPQPYTATTVPSDEPYSFSNYWIQR